ncbi:MAG: hypothetical protein KDD45_13495 [Bdellovibrionales bacterium]|nr:hypothetical protein [Bdellovibrionales bacterium]
MKRYKLSSIVEQIHKGSDIDINSFDYILSAKDRLSILKYKKVDTTSVWSLLKGLLTINYSKFIICCLLFLATLALTIAGPFILSYIVEEFIKTE